LFFTRKYIKIIYFYFFKFNFIISKQTISNSPCGVGLSFFLLRLNFYLALNLWNIGYTLFPFLELPLKIRWGPGRTRNQPQREQQQRKTQVGGRCWKSLWEEDFVNLYDGDWDNFRAATGRDGGGSILQGNWEEKSRLYTWQKPWLVLINHNYLILSLLVIFQRVKYLLGYDKNLYK